MLPRRPTQRPHPSRLLTAGLGALAAACTPPVPAPPAVGVEAAGPPETIVLVIGCTFRADRTTPHGHTVDTTPYLDRLAQDGVRFDHMIANAGWTRAGGTAIVSGQLPARWGIDDTGKGIANRGLPPEVDTLAERLARAGWATAGATANPNLNPSFGLTQGIAHYRGTDRLFREGQGHIPGAAMVDRLGAEIEAAVAEAPDAPLFVQVMFIDAHDPWDLDPLGQLAQGRAPTDAAPDRYDAALSKLDQAIAQLDQRLAALGRSDRVLIVTGDHGEGLRTPTWAGGGHGYTLYDPHVHIPLVVHGPGVAQGHVVGGIAQQLDLLPTVLSLAGLPPDPALPGTDQLPAIQGHRDRSATPEVLSVTRVMRTSRWRLTTPDWVALQTHAPKRRRSGRPPFELYRRDDRLQTTERADDHPWVAAALHSRGAAMWDQLLAIEQEHVVQPDDGELDHLRQLGYIE